MRTTLLCAIGAIGLVATPAIAGETPPSTDAPKITDKNDPNYMRCRTESVIGSRAKKKRVCMTNTQWAEYHRDNNALANALVEDARSAAGAGGN